MVPAEVKRLFPLRGLEDVLQLFRKQLQLPDPDLCLLSIVTGFIESSLIAQYNDSTVHADFPVVEWELVEELYKKFYSIISVVEGPATTKSGKGKSSTPPLATRETIKRVSDLIWNSLQRSTYKDRAHLQSLYSYLTCNKLDCFGVAFAVVAGCQAIGFSDVHLAISEDHAWIVFGPANQQETIEVTWHGKGFEDKRGEPVTSGVESQAWLYLAGRPVICDRHMEISAGVVLTINPSLNVTSACLELADLQRKLLWLMYDHNHLQKYPMGLGNLGELEEFAQAPDDKRPSSEELYRQSVVAARTWYNNFHVYPYTYQGSYFYRKTRYREAFAAWANAGDVIRRYIYSRDDEEIYKELLEIANEQIPSIMKTESSGHSARSILRDPSCFASLLRFYDGICMWEEGSWTPILHIGWAKPLISNIAKFDYDIRSQVIIETATDDEQIPEVGEKTATPTAEANNNSSRTTNNNSVDVTSPQLASLTAACGEQILNPNFLTGGDLQPFTTPSAKEEKCVDVVEIKREVKEEVVVDEEPQRPDFQLKLFSQKMKGLKNLLKAEKLNTQAILLQVTAQSQVGGGKKANRSSGWNAHESSHGGGGAGTTGGGAGGGRDATNNNQNKANTSATGAVAGGSGNTGGSASTEAVVEEKETASQRPKRARRE